MATSNEQRASLGLQGYFEDKIIVGCLSTPGARRRVHDVLNVLSIQKNGRGVEKQIPLAKNEISKSRHKASSHIPRMMVARPRAVPIPLPLIALGPTRLNLRKYALRRGSTRRERRLALVRSAACRGR